MKFFAIKRIIRIGVFVTMISSILMISCQTKKQYSSFKPGQLWLDNNQVHINAHGGGLLFHNGKYYWYGEHKIEGKAGNKAHVGVHVYSSKDLYNWKDEGIALSVVDEEGHDIEKECILERPKVIYNEKTKKFVMWFHLELKGKGYGAAKSGVAIADNVTGPFTFLYSLRPNANYWPKNVLPIHQKTISEDIKESYGGDKGSLPSTPDSVNLLGRDFKKGQMARDMTLFVDDDGTAYHVYSSEENSTTHISKLSDDYTTFAGEYVRVFSDRYMEAPTIFKTSEGKYYFIASDCTGWAPNAARSAVADHIFGPWTELGNPAVGEGKETTFRSQSTYILPVQGKKDAFIFMGDRWMPDNAINGRYIWLPIEFEDGRPIIKWQDEWTLDVFDK